MGAHLNYRRARYLSSALDLSQLPADDGAEVAFAGRSNAGKSSALNAITEQKTLARTSKTPGRTRMINLFQLTHRHRLVDLPGYGFAKVPESVRHQWGHTMERYLVRRKVLLGLMLLMDVRHPFTELDAQMLRWCSARRLPVHALLTKCDKLSRGKSASTLRTVERRAASEFDFTTVQLFSALDGRGVEEARSVLDAWFTRDPGCLVDV